jgi:hypothetical protein
MPALLERGYATLTAIAGIAEVSHAELLAHVATPHSEAVVEVLPETPAQA